MDGQEVDQYMAKISEALQLPDVPPIERSSMTSKLPPPDSNSSCEVCERGGDLVCCDLCPLVFHQRCIRPSLASLPKGSWVCAYCQLKRGSRAEREEAKQAIIQMSLLTRGYTQAAQSDALTSTTHAGLDNAEAAASNPPTLPPACLLRIARTGTATIVHLGKKYVVRRTLRKQIKDEAK